MSLFLNSVFLLLLLVPTLNCFRGLVSVLLTLITLALLLVVKFRKLWDCLIEVKKKSTHRTVSKKYTASKVTK